ncbi:MAG: SAM-dependent methyltransferase [Clostridia bacterium]|nr:SAM-dependent methyltransferase [Clostridia bacterium]
MLKLSERIMMAAEMVRHGKVAADIGTDHAYLPAWLVLNGVCPKALACDLRKGPLDNAKNTVDNYGVADRVTLRLSDGFDEIEPHEADDFIMCGMGGTLMTELVSRTSWLKDPKKLLILQPQSHAEDIREHLITNGFEIIREDACIDSGKLYCSFCARWTGEIKPYSEGYIYYGKLPECGKPEAKQYLQKVAERLKTKLEAEEKHGSAEKADYLRCIIFETEDKINGI